MLKWNSKIDADSNAKADANLSAKVDAKVVKISAKVQEQCNICFFCQLLPDLT